VAPYPSASPTTGLRILQLTPNQIPTQQAMSATTTQAEAANNIHALTSKESLIKFLHKCLFSPPKRTLLKVLEINQFTMWPRLTKEAVRKYLPESSPATDEGHMKRQHQCIQSTQEKVKNKVERIEYEHCMNPPQERERRIYQLFCFSGLLDPKAGTMYTDFTGKFPLCLVHGSTILFILYDRTTNSILATPVADTRDTIIVDTFTEQYRIFSMMWIQSKIQYNGQPGKQNSPNLPQKGKSHITTHRATQSSHQHSRKSNPNLQESPHRRPQHCR